MKRLWGEKKDNNQMLRASGFAQVSRGDITFNADVLSYCTNTSPTLIPAGFIVNFTPLLSPDILQTCSLSHVYEVPPPKLQLSTKRNGKDHLCNYKYTFSRRH